MTQVKLIVVNKLITKMILIATIFFITGFVFGAWLFHHPTENKTEIFFPDPKKRIELPTVYKAIKKLKPQNQLN